MKYPEKTNIAPKSLYNFCSKQVIVFVFTKEAMFQISIPLNLMEYTVWKYKSYINYITHLRGEGDKTTCYTGESWSVLHDVIGVKGGLSDFLVFIIYD